MTLLFLGSVGTTEVLVILLVVLLFFGGKKVPEMMRGLGKGVKSFKDGMNGLDEAVTPKEDKKPQDKEEA